ncbi:hypothetical protein [Mesonia sp. K7]|uniref:hypothetical protein n=1 Tax=Mesonia sp. K7 TaxID=2218606 RepID=UPI000DA90121|nr:hypothetical protein [Mesonia sp. K7]PZD79203.1 hypothetical protein DNG35_01565 [Mesonia sp. K7]
MKKYKITILNILVIIIILIILKQLNPVLELDGYSGNIKRLLYNTDDTVYSNQYFDSKFLEIKEGMSLDQVYDILGTPIREDKEENENYLLWFSMSPNSLNYRKRNVILENNKVVKIHSEYYID